MKNKESILFELEKMKNNNKNIDFESIETIISNLDEKEIKRLLTKENFKSEANLILSREMDLDEKISFNYNTSFIGIPKYRGVCTEDDKYNFVYGDLLIKDGKSFIYKRGDEKYYEVDSNTIGTSIGFKDANDTPLWTGDVVISKSEEVFEGIVIECTYVFLINWDRKNNQFVFESLCSGDIYNKTFEPINFETVKNKKFKCTILDREKLNELVKISTISRMHVEKLQKLHYNLF